MPNKKGGKKHNTPNTDNSLIDFNGCFYLVGDPICSLFFVGKKKELDLLKTSIEDDKFWWLLFKKIAGF